jgi:putative GTP pyrophosphokinase
MTIDQELTSTQLALVDAIVARYKEDKEKAEKVTVGLQSLVAISKLTPLIHSVRARTKDPEHLRDKLRRKFSRCIREGIDFPITPDNLFETINDLAGIRLLHLRTRQFQEINEILIEQIEEERYEIIQGPEARVWDNEYKRYFESIGVKTIDSDRMYTSVHYVVQPNKRSKLTGEIQVRTLAEELWGEVDHSINYPRPYGDVACVEQIKVLARVTSSCTRLVDSIFNSKSEADKRAGGK